MSQLLKYGSTWLNKWIDRCFQVVDRRTAQRYRVTPVLAKTQILKFYQFYMGKQKLNTSIIAQMSAKAVDSLYTQICLRTSNLLDSYYLLRDNF